MTGRGDAVRAKVRSVERILAAAAFLLLIRADLVAWQALPALAAATAITVPARRWAERHPGQGVRWLAATRIVAVGVVVYATGWGPALGIGYLFAAAEEITAYGAGTWRRTMAWSAASIVAGQVAIQAGAAPTYLDTADAHGLALLTLLGTCFAIRLVAHNVRAVEEARDELSRGERRFRSLVQHARDSIVVAGPDGTITYASPGLASITGRAADHYLDRDATYLVHPEDRPLLTATTEAINGRLGAVASTEVRVAHHDGSWIEVEVTLTNLLDDPSVGGTVANVRDVTERRRYEERLAHEATHDHLTGLPNRPAVLSHLELALARRRRSGAEITVLFVDLDGFKVVNDTFGHAIGDHVLVEAAARLRACVRAHDVVARFGGDEFVVVLDGIEPGSGEERRVPDRVRAAMASPFRVAGREASLSASVGLAVAADDETAQDLLRRADLAMYLDKKAARADGRVGARCAPDRHPLGDEAS